jgi:hypothetical protein
MQIVDAEPQLVNDLKTEMEILNVHEKPTYTIYAGRHPTLGRIVVISGKDKSGAIVELD